jgi:type III pantothenate kinase
MEPGGTGRNASPPGADSANAPTVLLAIDVGNTNTVLGLYEGDRLVHHFRIATNRSATSDEMGELMLSLVERRRIDPASIEGSILASVVPQANRTFVEACTRSFRGPPIVVGPGVKTGMPILVDQPNEVGADRIVNAVAGWARFKRPLVVVDFGTGTTFDAVSERGEYLGGAIAPGIDISMDALFARAAKLPRVELKKPARVIGKNTIHALQSGLLYGYAGLVDEVVERTQAELAGIEPEKFDRKNPAHRPAKVVATGGLAFLFEGVSRTLEVVDEFLTLDGLRILYGLNTGPKK